MNPACPPDDQLLALATDEPGSDAVREHVDECADCRMRVKLLRGEVAELPGTNLPASPRGGPFNGVRLRSLRRAR